MSCAPTATQTLDPLRLPLHGSRLIEASAGTGKTFTLALLYLRLILGHGGSAAFARPLTPPEILVVTFTRAATEELRARIRARLIEAAMLLRDEVPDAAADPLLHALCAEIPAETRAHCARRLALAADWMDEAAILTIHAWCYRMLREHAFAVNSPLASRLENEARTLEQQAAEDYWRTFVLGLEAELLKPLLDHWRDPKALIAEVRPLLPLIEELPPAPDESPREILRHWRSERAGILARIKSDWRAQGYSRALRDLFDQAARAKAFKQQRLNKGHRDKVIAALETWLAEPEQETPSIFHNESWQRMSSLAIAEIWNDPSQAPVDHPACQALAKLLRQLQELPPEPIPQLLTHAARWIWARIEQDKQRLGFITQQDLLVRLDQALRGPLGPQLAAIIRRQFPAVMVDEFQDTDPLQYRILDAIYNLRANAQGTCLLMVGDPKQAIYGFRGADIHAYLSARAATQGRHESLEVNYRSAPELIAAINALFALGEGREAGAFLLGGAIPFRPARAGATTERLIRIRGQPCAPLSAWVIAARDDQKALTKDAYRARSAEMAAHQIAHLLHLGQRGDALLPSDQDGWRQVVAGDVAVLVNNWQEAEAIRQALRQLDIASVYLSERKSVFATWVAADLLSALRAIADPFDDGLMRQALATRLLGRSLADLDRLNNDEAYWELTSEQLRALQVRWRRQGLLPMLYRLIAEFEIGARLLGTPDGERNLTDLLHLGELLQAASTELDGEQALLRFLDEAIADANSDRLDTPETYQLRLESDADLVRIVTIHKSKGLEYPLVFLPFIADCQPVVEPKPPIITHDEDQRRLVRLSADAQILDLVERERLGEDLRKLYVALTRACHAVWLGLGITPNLHRSAIGYLLGASPSTTGKELCQTIAQLPGAALIEEAPAPPLGDSTGSEVSVSDLAPARTIKNWRWHPWWISSYSAMRAQAWADSEGIQDLDDANIAHPSSPNRHPEDSPLQQVNQGTVNRWAAETAGEEIAREEGAETLAGLITAAWEQRPSEAEMRGMELGIGTGRAPSLHEFPRGGRYGTFLHGLLEWAARKGYAATQSDSAERSQLIARRCAQRRLNDWSEALDRWLSALLDRAWRLEMLGAPPLRLADLDPAQYQVELEFWLEARACDPRTIDRWIIQHVIPGQPRPLLNGTLLNGMLKGFIDLAFEHAGRYYVLDWKSNWLGPDDRAYTQEAMRATVLEHRYDLQCVIYLLALHRQLRARLPGYDYDRHLGGAIYVFLRGSEAPTQGVFSVRPPRILIEALDRMLAGDRADGCP